MLSTYQSILLIVGCIIVALGFLIFLRYFWAPSRRREHNELIGWQMAVLGTTYAVIIGFMLYAVWSNYQAADVNAHEEAIALVNVFHFAGGLPPESRDALQKLSRDYADAAISDEWPAMTRGELSPRAFGIMQELWATAMRVKVDTDSEKIALDHTLIEIDSLNGHRRLRHLESQSKMPGILWAILITGAVTTIGSSCMFGTENFKLHVVQVLSLTLLIAVALTAIADIDQPFRGGVHVSPSGFEYARLTFDQLMKLPK